ncbi:MAG: FtsQ-type POTRA domain-containing protein [Gracilibacteraceae bacterium]|nr:FtsQ-type POTRA domain-containing protein [Gracilibacteraceae bacterium]
MDKGVKKNTASLLHNTSFLCVVFAVVLIMAGILFVTQSGSFTVREVRPEGLQLIDEGDILVLLGAVQGENLFLLDTNALAHKIELHPLVDKAWFERRLPHTLILKVVERTPVALILTGEQLIEVDSLGTVLRCFDMWPDTPCPVLTGIQIQSAVGPGQVIEHEALSKALGCLADVPPELKTRINEIHVEAVGAVNLYLDTRAEVRLGIRDSYAGKLRLLAELIKDEAVQSARHVDLTSDRHTVMPW